MFFVLPLRIRDGRHFDAIPFVNGMLVAMNVVIFCLGWHPMVGPGTSPPSIVTYAFGHANVSHLAGNMFTLLVFGTAVNRRIGNGWYLITYLGTAVILGLFVRLLLSGYLMG